ncbi:hypothetical protein IFM89_009736 [Coptis chinensis]|uniref:Uncharacterized protein n=1 Tax=Coptis chinensis TaxID=261450 RepID=A0A835HDZ2_9MAGN|nr:hypothetical protein IFM89_009736 [Coptis chinensis]
MSFAISTLKPFTHRHFNFLPKTPKFSFPTPKPTLPLTLPQFPPQFDLKTYWEILITEINHKLDQSIPIKYPQQIYESMRYFVLAHDAKRTSPIMCIAVCELIEELERLRKYGRAIVMLYHVIEEILEMKREKTGEGGGENKKKK